jgi:hypothetical protein
MCRIVGQWYELVDSLPENASAIRIPVRLPCCIGFQASGWKQVYFRFMGLSKSGKFVVKDFEKLNLAKRSGLQRAMLMTLEVSSVCLRKAAAGFSLTRSAVCLVWQTDSPAGHPNVPRRPPGDCEHGRI